MNTTHHIDAGFSIAVDRLEHFISRLTRNDARLVLERESEKHWIVVDVANNDVVMLRATERLTAVKFMRAFAIRTAGASLDEASISGSGAGRTDGGLAPAPDSTQRLRLVL